MKIFVDNLLLLLESDYHLLEIRYFPCRRIFTNTAGLPRFGLIPPDNRRYPAVAGIIFVLSYN